MQTPVKVQRKNCDTYLTENLHKQVCSLLKIEFACIGCSRVYDSRWTACYSSIISSHI